LAIRVVNLPHDRQDNHQVSPLHCQLPN
jgi:hypothetical protein